MGGTGRALPAGSAAQCRPWGACRLPGSARVWLALWLAETEEEAGDSSRCTGDRGEIWGRYRGDIGGGGGRRLKLLSGLGLGFGFGVRVGLRVRISS